MQDCLKSISIMLHRKNIPAAVRTDIIYVFLFGADKSHKHHAFLKCPCEQSPAIIAAIPYAQMLILDIPVQELHHILYMFECPGSAYPCILADAKNNSAVPDFYCSPACLRDTGGLLRYLDTPAWLQLAEKKVEEQTSEVKLITAVDDNYNYTVQRSSGKQTIEVRVCVFVF